MNLHKQIHKGEEFFYPSLAFNPLHKKSLFARLIHIFLMIWRIDKDNNNDKEILMG